MVRLDRQLSHRFQVTSWHWILSNRTTCCGSPKCRARSQSSGTPDFLGVNWGRERSHFGSAHKFWASNKNRLETNRLKIKTLRLLNWSNHSDGQTEMCSATVDKWYPDGVLVHRQGTIWCWSCPHWNCPVETPGPQRPWDRPPCSGRLLELSILREAERQPKGLRCCHGLLDDFGGSQIGAVIFSLPLSLCVFFCPGVGSSISKPPPDLPLRPRFWSLVDPDPRWSELDYPGLLQVSWSSWAILLLIAKAFQRNFNASLKVD